MALSQNAKKVIFISGCLAGLFLSLLVNNAIPFVTAPTTQQALWVLGFAQSIENHSLFNPYAHNFGIPFHAPMAFGLPGAWLAAVFLRLGIPAWDAYTLTVAIFIAFSFFIAYKIARMFQVSPFASIVAATCWNTMMVIWWHQGYSMLASGFMFLDLYMFSAFKLFGIDKAIKINRCWIPVHALICIFSLFMDGYSFMMFAVCSSLWGIYIFYRSDDKKASSKLFGLHAVSLGIAYLLYARFIGMKQFPAASIDFFRGWGCDISFWLQPQTGCSWVSDMIGLSVSRSEKLFWGDASTFVSTFILVALCGALASFLLIKNKHKKIIFALMVLSLYLALGPSLKFYTIKPEPNDAQLMTKQEAIISTGSRSLWAHVPGFKNMRAVYRWTASGVFFAWMLMLLLAADQDKRKKRLAVAFMLAAIVFNIPHLDKSYAQGVVHRQHMQSVQADYIDVMANDVREGEKIAFLPFNNDFMVNYIASKLNVYAYNIGGDKNVSIARAHWPATMKSFKHKKIDEHMAANTLKLLKSGDADAVILTYVDLLWFCETMPEPPLVWKQQIAPVEDELMATGEIEIERRPFWSVVRLKR